MVANIVLQALHQADEMKQIILSSSSGVIEDSRVLWAAKSLQRIYREALILDLEYCLNRKVEHDLWNLSIKNVIDAYQKAIKEKNSLRKFYQAALFSYIESATGYYVTLLDEICSAFAINLPIPNYHLAKRVFLENPLRPRLQSVIQPPERTSLYYICFYCYMRLGDLARYGSRGRQAEEYYRKAVLLSPVVGQPYNQLALLESGKNNKLATVFYYVRSVAVVNPFPAASSNLSITLKRYLTLDARLQDHGRSITAFVSLFLKLHSLFYFVSNTEQYNSLIQQLTSSLTAHVATEAFTSWQLVQIMVINIFAYDSAVTEVDGNKNCEKYVTDIVMSEVVELIAGSLNSFLLPVHTFKEKDDILQYFALPAINITLDWLKINSHILHENGFSRNLQIWPSFCKLLNSFQNVLKTFSAEKFNGYALPEEQDLQGFRPLDPVITKFRFGDISLDADTANKLRAWKLTEFGKWFSTLPGSLIKTSILEDGTTRFEAALYIAQPPNELILQLEELSLNKDAIVRDEVPTSGKKSGHLSSDASSMDANVSVIFDNATGEEKPAGILKCANTSGRKKPRQNVALQGMLKREQEQQQQHHQEYKQVTFKSPSPSLSGSSNSQDAPTPPVERTPDLYDPLLFGTNRDQNNLVYRLDKSHTNGNVEFSAFRNSFSDFPALGSQASFNPGFSNGSIMSNSQWAPSQMNRNDIWRDDVQNVGVNPGALVAEQKQFPEKSLYSWQYSPNSQMQDNGWPSMMPYSSQQSGYGVNLNSESVKTPYVHPNSSWNMAATLPQPQQRIGQDTYSLFDQQIWAPHQPPPVSNFIQSTAASSINLTSPQYQSPWSNAPSPLQRLVEQQKQSQTTNIGRNIGSE